MKKIRKTHNLINIILMVLLLVGGSAVCALANEPAADAAPSDVYAVVVESSDEIESIDAADDNGIDEVGDVDAEGSNDADIAEDTEDEFTEVIEPPVVEDEDEDISTALWCEPGDGGMYYYEEFPDGTTKVTFVPDEIEESGVLGDASYYDSETGITTVTRPDGTVITYADDEGYSYSTASTYSTFAAPIAAEPEAAETATAEVVEGTIVPVVEEETAVLGDYEESASRNIPLTAGLAIFSGTVIALGVLWKLGLIAFI